MSYALTLAADGRILSACVVLTEGRYKRMPIVNVLPDGDITDYRYVDGEYVYDPIPAPEQPESQLTMEDRLTALEEENKQLKEALDLLLSGTTEEEGETDG